MLAVSNNKLYYNTNEKIVSMNFDGTGAVEYSPDVSIGYIYGMGIHGNTMVYELAKAPNETTVAYSYSLTSSLRSTPIQKEATINEILPTTEIHYETRSVE